MTDYQNEILDLLNDAEHEGVEEEGRRFIRWRFVRGMEEDLTTNMMSRLQKRVNTTFYIWHIYAYEIRNIED